MSKGTLHLILLVLVIWLVWTHVIKSRVAKR